MTEHHLGLPILPFATPGQWEHWLHEHHAASAGLWLKLTKKDAGVAGITYAEALDVALCFGWIDGQKAPFDETFWLQRFTRRGPRSRWSKINRNKAAALIEAGRMQPAGLAEVDAARSDGRWDDAYASQSRSTVPPDLEAALAASPAAAAFFQTLNSVNRYAVLYRIGAVKKPETRARKIAAFVAMLEKGEKIYP